MHYYALFYEGADNYVQRRAPHRDAHLALVRGAHARGDIVMAGALGDPPGEALLIFRGEGPQVAETFARQDPYVINGVVARWRVVPWHVVAGAES